MVQIRGVQRSGLRSGSDQRGAAVGFEIWFRSEGCSGPCLRSGSDQSGSVVVFDIWFRSEWFSGCV